MRRPQLIPLVRHHANLLLHGSKGDVRPAGEWHWPAVTHRSDLSMHKECPGSHVLPQHMPWTCQPSGVRLAGVRLHLQNYVRNGH